MYRGIILSLSLLLLNCHLSSILSPSQSSILSPSSPIAIVHTYSPKAKVIVNQNSTLSFHSHPILHPQINIQFDSMMNIHRTPRVSMLTTSQQILIYAKHKKTARFGNKADFPAIQRLAKHSDLCSSGNPMLIGGVNEGGFTLEILAICPDVDIRGFEIQPSVFARVQLKMKDRSNVRLYNVGWGEESLSGLGIGGSGGGGGLFVPKGGRFASWRMQNVTASTVVMRDWCEVHNITVTTYVVIDVEGFEPKVLRGMHLGQDANQKRFPHIQFELGGTWATRDPRHGGKHEWSQFDAAMHLDRFGYQLFLIGVDGWMPVTPDFFKEGSHMLEEEGNGKFVQGNLLCVHSQYASNSILETVVANAVLSV